jgi:hypothetical protein
MNSENTTELIYSLWGMLGLLFNLADDASMFFQNIQHIWHYIPENSTIHVKYISGIQPGVRIHAKTSWGVHKIKINVL